MSLRSLACWFCVLACACGRSPAPAREAAEPPAVAHVEAEPEPSPSEPAATDAATGDDSGDLDSGRADAPTRSVPRQHRASAPAACDSARVKGDPQGDLDPPRRSRCKRDSQCKKGKNGRCAPTTYEGPSTDVCYYDACYVDADCPAGMACACGPGVADQPHECVPANCRLDAECGPAGEGYCSPTPGSCSGVAGWYCHTPGDGCWDDGDCGGGNPALGGPRCLYDATAKRWACGGPRSCI